MVMGSHGWSGWSPSISGDHRPLQLEKVSINPPSNPWGQKSPPPPTVEGKKCPRDQIGTPEIGKMTPPPTVEGKNHPPLQPLKAKITLTRQRGRFPGNDPPSNRWGQKSPPPPTVEGKKCPHTQIRDLRKWKIGSQKEEKERPKKSLFKVVISVGEILDSVRNQHFFNAGLSSCPHTTTSSRDPRVVYRPRWIITILLLLLDLSATIIQISIYLILVNLFTMDWFCSQSRNPGGWSYLELL